MSYNFHKNAEKVLTFLQLQWRVTSDHMAQSVRETSTQSADQYFFYFLHNSGTKKNFLTSGKSQLSYLFTKRVIKLAVDYRGISLVSFYLTVFTLG
jgi:hypothetical protein